MTSRSPLPPCIPLSIPQWSWNISWHILCPAGCAGRGRRVSWRAQRPSSPSWCGKYSEDSGLDRAAETLMTAGPTLPYCFFLKRRDTKACDEEGRKKSFFKNLFLLQAQKNTCWLPSTTMISRFAVTAQLWKVKSTWLLQHESCHNYTVNGLIVFGQQWSKFNHTV